MKKRLAITVLASFILVVLALSFTSALEGCCVTLDDGNWCQQVEESQCASDFAPTSCDAYAPCILGTCIDSNKGECMPNTPNQVCIEEGGQWNSKTIDEIEVCQLGCCLIGDQASLETQAGCKQQSSDYGVENEWDPTISDLTTCSGLSGFYERGACVVEEEYYNNCFESSRLSCFDSGGRFYLDKLCTAEGLSSSCAKTGNTILDSNNGKIYFLDSCGNKANIYDSRMFTESVNGWNPEMIDYWTTLQEPNCNAKTNPASCGNCDYGAGNAGKEYNRFEMDSRYKPDFGKYVCADLGCVYQGDKKEHGESWCATVPGVADIQGDPTSGLISQKTRDDIAANPGKYNLPGARYLKLYCANGEVKPEECADFRNEICMEGIDPQDGLQTAECFVNDYRGCYDITDKTTCEAEDSMCQWVPGYRFDGLLTEDDQREEYQGSCLPLFSPGFQFWTDPEESNGTANAFQGEFICGLASISEQVFYETHWMTKRDDFAEVPTIDAAHRCLENCYAIPEYGVQLGPEGMSVLWDGKSVRGMAWIPREGNSRSTISNAPKEYDSTLKLEEMTVSLRRGQYCEKESDPEDDFLFKVPDDYHVRCIKRAETDGTIVGEWVENAKKKTDPLFWTNDQWIESITRRAKEMGDCGYLAGISSTEENPRFSNPSSELVTAVFQKLKQDGTPKDDATGTQILYQGEGWLLNGYRGKDGNKTFVDNDNPPEGDGGSVLPGVGDN